MYSVLKICVFHYHVMEDVHNVLQCSEGHNTAQACTVHVFQNQVL